MVGSDDGSVCVFCLHEFDDSGTWATIIAAGGGCDLPEAGRETAWWNAILVDDVATTVQGRDRCVDFCCTVRFAVSLTGYRVAISCCSSTPRAWLPWLISVVFDSVTGNRVPLRKPWRAG